MPQRPQHRQTGQLSRHRNGNLLTGYGVDSLTPGPLHDESDIRRGQADNLDRLAEDTG